MIVGAVLNDIGAVPAASMRNSKERAKNRVAPWKDAQGRELSELIEAQQMPQLESLTTQIPVRPIIRFQRLIRSKPWHKRNEFGSKRLHCKNLAERLLFEASFGHGLFRLVNQLLIFMLLLIALQFAGDPSVQRGVYMNLKEIFDVLKRKHSISMRFGA